MSSSAALFPNLETSPAPGLTSERATGSVLLVEDEDSLAELLFHVLGRMKVPVLRAADGAQALQLFVDHRDAIGLAFVDCHLPDVCGADLCATLRALAPGLPLLITSGRDQRALESSLASGGPTGFLPKPYMPTDVIRRVNALLPSAR